MWRVEGFSSCFWPKNFSGADMRNWFFSGHLGLAHCSILVAVVFVIELRSDLAVWIARGTGPACYVLLFLDGHPC